MQSFMHNRLCMLQFCPQQQKLTSSCRVHQAGMNGTKPAAPAAAKKKVAKDLSNTPFTNTNR